MSYIFTFQFDIYINTHFVWLGYADAKKSYKNSMAKINYIVHRKTVDN